jgi:hypothetical protein
MVLGWIEEDGNWTEITGQIPFSTASAGSLHKRKQPRLYNIMGE